MKIFLTGGSGMVGRNISAIVAGKGHIIDAPSRQQLDLMNLLAVKNYLIQSAPDLVIHAAGLVGGIQANIASPFDFCYENLQIGLNVVKGAHEAGITQLINLGSSCMYPRDAINPLNESALLSGELEPTNEGYALAKIAVARLADYMSRQYGVAYKTIIPCNLYGLWDKFGLHNSHMIPAVIRKIHEAKIKGLSSVEIWGDGTARREFLYTGDLVDFIISALESFDSLPNYINVGLGADYSITEYYQAVKDVLGYQGSFRYDLTKPVGMKQKLVNVNLQRELGWHPKTDLKQGIEQTYQYFLGTCVE